MKLRSASAICLLFMPLTMFAASKSNSASVTLPDPVVVAGTSVPAGDYKVQWQGESDSVQVSFLQGKKVVANAPAKLVNESSPYDGAVEVKKESDGTSVLEDIAWKSKTLVFDADSSGSQPQSQSSGEDNEEAAN
jgi:hypothetical protein